MSDISVRMMKCLYLFATNTEKSQKFYAFAREYMGADFTPNAIVESHNNAAANEMGRVWTHLAGVCLHDEEPNSDILQEAKTFLGL